MDSELIISTSDQNSRRALVAAKREIEDLCTTIKANTMLNRHKAVVVKITIERKRSRIKALAKNFIDVLTGFKLN